MVRLRKREFVNDRNEVLGYINSSRELAARPSNKVCVAKARLPMTIKEPRSFLLFCSINRTFVPRISHMAATFHTMVGTHEKFEWTNETKSSFNALGKAMCLPLVLSLPNIEKLFHVFLDASKHALGNALVYKGGSGRMEVEQFASWSLRKCEKS